MNQNQNPSNSSSRPPARTATPTSSSTPNTPTTASPNRCRHASNCAPEHPTRTAGTPPPATLGQKVAAAAVASAILAAAITSTAVVYHPYFAAKWATDTPTSENDPRVRTATESPHTATLWNELVTKLTTAAGEWPATTDVIPVCTELAPTPDYQPGTPFVRCYQTAHALWDRNSLTVTAAATAAQQAGWTATAYSDATATTLQRDGRTVVVTAHTTDTGATTKVNLRYDTYPPPP